MDFNSRIANYQNFIHLQSSEINQSVSDGGAGDQGHVFGYATNENQQLLPAPYLLASELMKAHQELRVSQTDCPLLPDAKCQVTLNYSNNGPLEIKTIILSSQHEKDWSQPDVKTYVIDQLIKPVLKEHGFLRSTLPDLIINPSGLFTVGGPKADTGLTGRKIIVDTYGGFCAHGGGAFSGKDGTKIDRSAAYAARFLAKHVVWVGLAEQCTIEIGYAIGKAQPVAFRCDTSGTGKYEDDRIASVLRKLFDLRPKQLIERFSLNQPIFHQTAKNGHFTDSSYPWELKDNTLIENILFHLNDAKRYKNTDKVNNKQDFQESNLHEAYGYFPYIILKVGCAMHMQIPIHFITNSEYQSTIDYPGKQLLDVDKKTFKLSKEEQIESLHEDLLELTQKIFNKIEKDKGVSPRLCLVEGPEKAYYFEADGIEFNSSIPDKGNLITQDKALISMNEPHYRK